MESEFLEVQVLTNLHVFLCRKGSECFTVVAQDTAEGASQSLGIYYDDVKYVREEPEGSPFIKKWVGTRRIGSSVLKHCAFNSVYCTRKKKPLHEA